MATTARTAPRRSARRSEGAKSVRQQKPRPAAERLVILRTGERGAFRRCRQRWWWSWREGLTPPFATNAMWFGEGIHFALAEWYKKGTKRGPNPVETFEKWVGEERRRIFTTPNPAVDETEIVDAKELGMAMLGHYVEHYGKDSSWSFLCTEQSFQKAIALGSTEPVFGVKLPLEILYGITFDGVFRDLEDNSIWLAEHKTAKSISTAHLTLDDQAGSYWATATDVLRQLKLIKPNEQIEGIMYNYLRKSKPDERDRDADGMYLNKDGSVSLKQPAPYFHREPVYRFPGEVKTQVQRIKDEATEMALVKAGVLPVTKNPTKDCVWDCSFFQMCQLHEAGEDWQSFRDMVFTVADPYEKHRKSAAE